MRRARGLSLVEIVLALAVLGLCFMFAASLIPTGIITLQRGQDMQAATGYAQELMEDVRQTPASKAGRDRELDVPIGSTTYHATRDIVKLNGQMIDVVVTVSWRKDVPPVVLATRLQQAVKEP